MRNNIVFLPPGQIIQKANRRAIDPEYVNRLAESIAEVGLLNPITVAVDEVGHILIAGAHRLAAVRQLGWDEVACVVSDAEGLRAELATIDENLIRNELTKLEQGEALERRDEILTELGERAKVGQGRPKENGDNLSPLKTTEDIAKEVGLGKKTAKRRKAVIRKISKKTRDAIRKTDAADNQKELEKLAKLTAEQQTAVAELMSRNEAKSVAVALRKIRAEEQQALGAEMKTNPASNRKYQVLYADPPWKYDNQIHGKGAADDHYSGMEIDDIKALPENIGLQLADNAVLFLWVTNPFLAEGLAIVKEWGFKYKTNAVWVKRNLKKPGLGTYVRGRHELLFIATRGSFAPLDQNISPPIGSVIEADIREHSTKPDEVYEIIERLYPGCSCLELFARRTRDGWDAWGNEVDGRHQATT